MICGSCGEKSTILSEKGLEKCTKLIPAYFSIAPCDILTRKTIKGNISGVWKYSIQNILKRICINDALPSQFN
jgi:hypothetical protein